VVHGGALGRIQTRHESKTAGKNTAGTETLLGQKLLGLKLLEQVSVKEAKQKRRHLAEKGPKSARHAFGQLSNRGACRSIRLGSSTAEAGTILAMNFRSPTPLLSELTDWLGENFRVSRSQFWVDRTFRENLY
jgi:hypothetical protein